MFSSSLFITGPFVARYKVQEMVDGVSFLGVPYQCCYPSFLVVLNTDFLPTDAKVIRLADFGTSGVFGVRRQKLL